MADKISYVAGDFDTIRTELFAKLQSMPGWKDVENESSVGNTLIRLYAYVGDLLFYKMNKLANESYLDTVQIKENMFKIIKMLNYEASRAIPSHGEVTFSISEAHYNNIIIPQGTLLTTDDNVSFYTTNEIELIAGNTSVDCNVVQGLQREEVFVGTGATNQEYYININTDDYYVGNDVWRYTIDEFKAIKLYINEVQWTNIENLVDSESSDQIYIIENFNDYGVRIRFGDGTFGKVPALGDNIKVIYNVNIGKGGNINSGEITVIESSIYDSALNLQTLTVENEYSFVNGDDPESLEEIRYNAPKYFKTGDRGITKDDFESLILSEFANILDINIWGEEDKDAPNIKLFNQINFCILIDDGTGRILDPNTDGLNYNNYYNEIDEFIKQKRSLTVWRKYHVPEKVQISMKVRYKKLSNYKSSTVENNIQTEITNYFTENGLLGADINHSDLVNIIDSIPGLDYCFVELKNDNSDIGYNIKNISIDDDQYPSINKVIITREQ